MVEHGDDGGAALERRMAAIEAEMAELRAENDRLRAGRTRSVPDSGGEPQSKVIGRRLALRKAAGLAAGAAAGGVAAVVVGAEPAAAANGGNVVLGSEVNSATAATGIGVQGSAAKYGFGVADNDVTSPITQRPAVFGHAKESNFEVAVYGVAENGANGVQGAAQTGAAILGISTMGFGGYFAGGGPQPGVRVFATGTETTSGTVGIKITATNHLALEPGSRVAPPSDTIAGVVGQVRWTADGALWACVTAGTPGTWRRLTGTDTAGQLTVLPAPVRVYDSRPGTAPTAVGPKTPFAANTTRTFDLKANSSGVPAGATAALVTLLLLNAANGSGNLTIWANGVAKPLSNSVVWGGSAGRFTATAVTAVDSLAQVQVNASLPTDLVIDVVGYYR